MNPRHLHFTQSLEPIQGGGLATSALSLHRELIAAGIGSTLCATCGGHPQYPGDRTFEFRRIKPDALYFAPELKRMAKELVSTADIVHGHGLYVGTNFCFGVESRRQRKPLVYHPHGFLEPWILKRSRWKKRLVHWLFEDENFRYVRLWRALTQKEAGQIRELGIRAPIAVIPNGVDLNEFPPPADPAAAVETPLIPGLAKTRPRVLFLSRIHPKKGLDMLLPAWRGLEKERREWELVVAGPDDSGYAAQVQRLARALEIDAEVRFTGPVAGRARAALLYSADLFVLPSYSEGFSMAILEAMACGLPVLATRNCNFPQLTQCGAGWECDAESESVANALREALTASEAERKQRGSNARRLIDQRYAWPVVLKDFNSACAAYC